MDVTNAEVASGQTVTPVQAGAGSDNTGQSSDRGQSLSDAITAAIEASRKGSEADTEKVDAGTKETAGETASSEDAKPGADAKGESIKDKATSDKEAEPKSFEAPAHWPKADREAFAGLPAPHQELIRRLARDLEGGFTRKSQELGSKAKYAEAVASLIDETTRAQLAQSGANELQYFGYLNQVQQFAARDPVGYLKWAMQSLGVSPEHLGFPQSKPEASPRTHNPELEALLSDPKVKELEAKYAALEGKLTEREKAEVAARQAYAGQQIRAMQGLTQAFRAAQDDAGQLRYPHFDTVHRHMGALMDTDPDLSRLPDGPEKMHHAYEMAVRARPDLYKNIFETSVETEVAKRVAAAEKAKEVARAKSVTAVKPASGVATRSAKPNSLDDIISSAMSTHGFGRS